jgi:hypothetical protein
MKGRGPYELLHNKYFKLLSDKQYQIEVLSPGWIDFCSEASVVVVACTERHWSVSKILRNSNYPFLRKSKCCIRAVSRLLWKKRKAYSLGIRKKNWLMG